MLNAPFRNDNLIHICRQLSAVLYFYSYCVMPSIPRKAGFNYNIFRRRIPATATLNRHSDSKMRPETRGKNALGVVGWLGGGGGTGCNSGRYYFIFFSPFIYTNNPAGFAYVVAPGYRPMRFSADNENTKIIPTAAVIIIS